MQHHTGTNQCGSSLAIPLRVSDEWHRIKYKVYHVVIVVEGVGVGACARARCVIIVVRVLVLEVGWSFVSSLSPLGAVLKSSWSPSPLDAAAGAIMVAIVLMVWGLGTGGGGVTCQHWGIVGLVTLVLVAVVVASDLFSTLHGYVPIGMGTGKPWLKTGRNSS